MCHPERTGQGYLAGGHHYHHHHHYYHHHHLARGRGDLLILVRQLLLDQSLGAIRLVQSLGLELVEQVHEGETLDEVDGDGVAPTHLHGPGHVDGVGGGGGELAQGGDVDGPRRSLGLGAGLVGRDRVGQGTELLVDLDTGVNIMQRGVTGMKKIIIILRLP